MIGVLKELNGSSLPHPENMRMVDVHCHLTAPEFEGRVESIVSEARSSGVEALITSGQGLQDSLKALELASIDGVYASLGVPPYELGDHVEVMELIRRNRGRVVAVGEVGLDYWRAGRETWEVQRRVFRDFIHLARELDLPLVIHSRSAGKYAIEILLEERAERVVMHAFDGAASHAVRAAEHGIMFSIPPSIARSPQKQKLVKRVPLENLLLESDAPALAPSPGEINHPRNVRVSVEWVSRLKGLDVEKVAEALWENTFRVFELRV